MLETNLCPACGLERPSDAPGGLCPRCLMRMGLDDAPSPRGRDRRELSPHRAGRILLDRIRSHETIIELGGGQAVEHESAEPVDPSGRLQFLTEIARGGVGVVLWCRDTTLGRDLAVKVLQERHRDRPEMIGRFIEEARIAGQLQHPGIVPIHELGTLSDRRPYFTMKLVKGRTLAEILSARADRSSDWPHLLAIFLQITQTIAYAHGRRVLHLDLKPANIMVGKYGEVQVMDWGLARVLRRDADHLLGTGLEDSGAGSDTAARDALPHGRFMGTPDYMAPEQFGGDPSRVDERTDVFALGVILCEILTARQVYEGSSVEEVRDRAAQGVLGPAIAELEACGADKELIALSRDCLAAEQAARPSHAGVIAERLSAHLEGVAERLRRAELARVEAQARAAEERKRRRLTGYLAALAVALVALAGASYVGWTQRQQAARDSAALVLREVEVLRDAAMRDPMGDPARWEAALDASGRAGLLMADAPESAKKRLDALAADVARGFRRADSDRRLLGRLEFAHAEADDGAFRDSDMLFEAAFREAGLDLAPGDPATVGRSVAARPRAVAQAIIVALDCWAIVRREREGNLREDDVGPWQAPLAAARIADPEPWRNLLRDVLSARDREGLARLAEADDLEQRPAASLWLLGRLLIWDHQTERAQRMLARAWRAHPDNYWINLDLSLFLSFPPERPDDAFLYNTSTLALRPDSAAAHVRRGALIGKKDFRAAEAEIREGLRLWPDYAFAHWTLAELFVTWERWQDAATEFRAAIRLRPRRYDQARLLLGDVLIRLGAQAENSPVPATRPEQFDHWYNLGLIRLRRGDGGSAIEAFARAVSVAEPGTPEAADIKEAQKQVETRDRLRAIINGEVRARDNAERMQLLRHCVLYDWAAGAAKLYADALEADPNLPAIRGESPRWQAARNAARAGTSPTGDDPPPDDITKARLRRQALAWMRADLEAWTKQIAPDKPETRRRAADFLRRYQVAREMAGVREPEALKALPDDERAAWEAFWRDVAAFLPAEAR